MPTHADADDDVTRGQGAKYFSEPELVGERLQAIQGYLELLLDLYNEQTQPSFPMKGWIAQKSQRIAQIATSLSESESPPTPVEVKTTGKWFSPDDDPWIRITKMCPFCGLDKLITQSGDNQRINAYCENVDCDARELVVLVLKDGPDGRAHLRTDVQRLKGGTGMVADAGD